MGPQNSRPAYSRNRSWTAQERNQAAIDAGKAGTVRDYEEMTEDEIRAEYISLCEIDAHAAEQLQKLFPWLRKEQS